MSNESRLLNLPAELRNSIWHFMAMTHKTAGGAIEIGSEAETPAILLTCKQVREEMVQLYYHHAKFQYTDGGMVSRPPSEVPLTKWLAHMRAKQAPIKQLTLRFEELRYGDVPECLHSIAWYQVWIRTRNEMYMRREAARVAAQRILGIIVFGKVRIEELVISRPECGYLPSLNFDRWWTAAMLDRIDNIRKDHIEDTKEVRNSVIGNLDEISTS